MNKSDRTLAVVLAGILLVGLAAGTGEMSAQGTNVRLDSYAEWKQPGALIVDGQRVVIDADTRWKGKFSTIDATPIGYEVRVRGVRRSDGAVLAREIDARPNGSALFEAEVHKGTDELEGLWLRNREAFEATDEGKKVSLGAISTDSMDIARVQGMARRLAPPYVDQSKLRVYVIDNNDWSAMAMGNGAVWVFKGIMNDMSDEELAIIVGHELAHYTHEHSRRQMRRDMWMQMGSLAALAAAEAIDDEGLRALAQVGGVLGFTAWRNGFGRDLEDQADRVGLRYAYEAGYDVKRAPVVWQRFLDKYGDHDRLTSFFFSDHSTAAARRRNLEQEIRFNYTR